jgi:hypothetical protein
MVDRRTGFSGGLKFGHLAINCALGITGDIAEKAASRIFWIRSTSMPASPFVRTNRWQDYR